VFSDFNVFCQLVRVSESVSGLDEETFLQLFTGTIKPWTDQLTLILALTLLLNSTQ